MIKPQFKPREEIKSKAEIEREQRRQQKELLDEEVKVELEKQREIIRKERERQAAIKAENKKKSVEKRRKTKERKEEINWNDVDDRLVYGELVWSEENQAVELNHPTVRELAERLNCSFTLVGKWSASHDCVERRKKAVKNFGIENLMDLARRRSRIGPKNLRQLTEFLVHDEVGRLVHQETGQVLLDEKYDEFGMRAKHALPIAEIERLLVHGEPYIDEDEQTVVRYPRDTELAKRYGTTTSVINEISRHGHCTRRRREAEAETRNLLDKQMVELRVRSEVESRGLVLTYIDDYIDKFGQALKTDKVKINNVKDFDRLVRLREFVQGNPDSRKEFTGGITLEAIQRRFQNDGGDLPPELTGEVIDVTSKD